jgi:hypothetical protein
MLIGSMKIDFSFFFLPVSGNARSETTPFGRRA